MEARQRKVIITITILYTILILYFMFIGFGRIDAAEHTKDYTFIIIPDEVFKFPKVSDLQHFTMMDLIGLGNLAGFIPFGILIPLLYRTKFIRFITLFFLSILVLETLQVLTLLGSFDINDALQNSLGAAVGFCTYKIGFRSKNTWRNLIITGTFCAILSIGVLYLSEIIDRSFFIKVEGPIVELNELKEKNGNTSMSKNLRSFEIGGEKIEPKLNVYESGGKKFEKYTYILKNKDIIISGYCGVPDSIDYDGGVTFSADGKKIYMPISDFRLPAEEKNQAYPFRVEFNKVNELTITIEGNEKIWDVTFKEMKYWWNLHYGFFIRRAALA